MKMPSIVNSNRLVRQNLGDVDTRGLDKKYTQQQGVHTSETRCGHWSQTGRAKSVHSGGVSIKARCPQGGLVLYIQITYCIPFNKVFFSTPVLIHSGLIYIALCLSSICPGPKCRRLGNKSYQNIVAIKLKNVFLCPYGIGTLLFVLGRSSTLHLKFLLIQLQGDEGVLKQQLESIETERAQLAEQTAAEKQESKRLEQEEQR